MSRMVVNLEKVKNAKEELEAQGVYPSIKALSEHIGYGSPNTILKYMRELRGRETGLFGELGMVSEELSRLVLQLHNTLQSEAQKTIDLAVAKAHESNQRELDAAHEELTEARRVAAVHASANEDLKARLSTAESTVADLSTKYNAAQLEVARLAETNVSAQSAISDRDNRLAKLEGQLNHEKAAYKHYEQAVMEQRAKANEDHQKAIHRMELAQTKTEDELERCNETLAALNLRIGDMDRALSLRAQEVERLNAELKKSDEKFELQENHLDELRIQRAGDAARLQLLTTQSEKLTSQLEERSAEAVRALTLAQQMESELRDAKSELATLRLKAAERDQGRAKPKPPSKKGDKA
jgi:chromosome segregation ATPase